LALSEVKTIHMKNFPVQFIVFSFIILAFAACDKDRNHPGYSYFPDMRNSRAYETYSVNPNFADSTTERMPVLGTIPRGMIPFDFEKTLEDRALAGQIFFNPVKIRMRDVNQGKKLYKIFCYNCHGLKGNGKGYLFTSDRFGYQPASLISDKMMNAPRGEFYHVITLGYGVMGAHGPQIRPEDRWRIIEYIKVKLQGKKLGERTISVVDDSPKESNADFESRLAKLYPNQKGIGPVKSLSLGAINNQMAEEGQKIYKQMCTSCHKPTKRYIGPAPKGILERRTPEWIMNMILNPEEMVTNDPIAKELLERYLSPMADQNLTEEEARKVLEYFRTIK